MYCIERKCFFEEKFEGQMRKGCQINDYISALRSLRKRREKENKKKKGIRRRKKKGTRVGEIGEIGGV